VHWVAAGAGTSGSKRRDVTAFSNTRKVRIEWGDCDPAGIVFYPRYFEIFDAATAALFERALAMTKIKSLKTFAFAGYPLVRTRARFVRPTRYGDDVTVESVVTFGHASFEIVHHITHNGLTCVECAETRVWVVHDPADPGQLKSHPIPEAVRQKFNLP
jgi:4-hydroxybenzoyl-CoA thioesterase